MSDPKQRDTRTQREREYDRLEEELSETTDPTARKYIKDAMRDMDREDQEHRDWEDEGFNRGWF